MRQRFGLFLVVLSLAFAAPGCKFVKNADREAKRAAAEAEADVVTTTIDQTWDSRVLPHIREVAVPFPELAKAIAADLASAGAAHGYRQESEGSPWNFATRIEGTIVAANTQSKAATIAVDVDGDGDGAGALDATLQLGPVIRGTTLRDVLPFISFTDFRDQIEFAKLARAFNARAYETALQGLQRDALIGAKVTATGVFTIRAAGGKFLITPVAIEVTP